MRWRKLLTTLHLAIGLAAAPFLVVLGTTGAVMVFETQLDDALNSRLTHVVPTGHPLAVAEMMRRVAPTGARLLGVQVPADERHSYDFAFAVSGHRGPPTVLFVDQYTGRVLGTGAQGNDLMAKIHSLHLRLLAGRTGQDVVIAAGLALLFLSISGLILWWPGKILRVRWMASGPRLVLDLHRALGAYAWIFLMMFSLTAAVIHWDDQAERVFAALTGGGVGEPLPAPAASCGTRPALSADSLLALARGAAPGARPTVLLMPTGRSSYARVSMRYPEDRTPAGRTVALLEECTGRVAYLQTSRSAPPAFRLARMWNREVHTGDIFGWPTRILAALASLTLPLMALTGPLIWWTRRRARPHGRSDGETAVAAGALSPAREGATAQP